MESLWRKGIAVLMVMMMVKCTVSTLHKVGTRGWIADYNYTEWSSQQHFDVGDWLLFIFDKHYFNVLEVNETNYETCNDQGFIKNITRGGRDVVQLTEARTYYYLSSGGYCWHGMKVAINVEQLSPSPAPAPANNGSPSNTCKQREIVLSAVVSMAFAWWLFLVQW